MTAGSPVVDLIFGQYLTPVTVYRSMRDFDGRVEQERTFVILHGGAISSGRRGMAQLAMDMSSAGLGQIIVADFPGHGDSTLTLDRSSLAVRYEISASLISELAPPGNAVTIIAFSMAGDSAVRLAEHYPDRVDSLVLCAPAAYSEKAYCLPFGPDFSELIRSPRSWGNSLSFDRIGKFEGGVTFVFPSDDRVIPAEISEILWKSACAGRTRLDAVSNRYTVSGSTHGLAKLVSESLPVRAEFIEKIVGLIVACTHRMAS